MSLKTWSFSTCQVNNVWMTPPIPLTVCDGQRAIHLHWCLQLSIICTPNTTGFTPWIWQYLSSTIFEFSPRKWWNKLCQSQLVGNANLNLNSKKLVLATAMQLVFKHPTWSLLIFIQHDVLSDAIRVVPLTAAPLWWSQRLLEIN